MQPGTPLPWELSNKFARDKVYEGGLLVANCHVESDLRPKTACEQNAAYIAHAANLYPELVAALERIAMDLACHPADASANDLRQYLNDCFIEASTALAKCNPAPREEPELDPAREDPQNDDIAHPAWT